MRAGAHVLMMAASPIHRKILRVMGNRTLTIDGNVYKVSDGGHEALFVAFIVERWLQAAPQGPIDFESQEAETAVTALAEGWSAAVVHMLAREPMTLTELDRAIDDVGRRELMRLLAALQKTGQVDAMPTGGEPIYAATDWLRRGIAPLIVSARLERRSPTEDMVPIDSLDVEAGFRMSLALIELPKQLSGVCKLQLNLDEGQEPRISGVTAQIDCGQVIACEVGFEQQDNAWAVGPVEGWLDTVIDLDAKAVNVGGDKWLTKAVVSAIHETLFGMPLRPGPRNIDVF